MASHLQIISLYDDSWIIKKWSGPYLGASENGKENLVYLIADAETVQCLVIYTCQTYTLLVI